MPADGTALILLSAGSIFAYAGVTGKSALGTLYAIVSGKSPGSVGQATLITGTGNPNAVAVTPGTVTGGGSAFGQALAAHALSFKGHAYAWGGAPHKDASGGWDCSSAETYWIGSLGHAVPGGPWNPDVHGPVAADYLSWPGAVTIPRSQAGAGDLCCWSTHVGTAISNTQMISALNPSLGTEVTGIESGGPQGETLTCRRIS
jgi:cell wall-associated NlpC family hydrolase